MSLELEKLSPDNADLIKSLRELDISDEDIAKSLNIPTEEKVSEEIDKNETIEEEVIEKSIEEKIADKKAELGELEKSIEPDNDVSKFNEISKSLTDKVEESNKSLNEKFEGLVDLIKSLAEGMVSIKEHNEQLVKDNDELKKSFSGSEEVLRRIADFTPGLKSLSGLNPIDRFQKSTTEESDKETMSISKQKGDISSLLSKRMDDDPEFAKSLGDDISSFECSNRISPKLKKVFDNDLNITLVE